MTNPDPLQRVRRISATDDEKQIAYGMVYAPMEVDSWGEAMTAEDIETMAHRFMALKLNKTIDEMHDEQPKQDVYPVESFIARKGDPDYPEGAWVLGVKVEDSQTWEAIKSGQLNGFSFQAMVKKVPVVAEITFDPEIIGRTENVDDHDHLFFVEMDDEGQILGGYTSTNEGHSHKIIRGTATETVNGHAHRYFMDLGE